VSEQLNPAVYRVFFSHGGEDTFIVNEYFGPKVRASGAVVFIDEGEVSYGGDFRDIVFRELQICDEILVLLTPSSVKRPWIFAELGASILRGVHVVAIRYGVSEEDLRALGILSILGTTRLMVPGECDKYVLQLRQRVQNKCHG
jgi:TIR domain-containing protein